MIEIGRVCIKIAGREAGRVCVIIDKLDDKFVIIDGDVKRRKCNIAHLDFAPVILKIKKNASTEETRKALIEAGFKLKTKDKKTRKEKKQEKTKKKTTAKKEKK